MRRRRLQAPRGLVLAPTRVVGPILLVLLAPACVQQRVVKWNPPLGSLPGAQTSMPVTRAGRFNFADPMRAPEEGIRQKSESGEVTLFSRSGRHLMVHIYTTLLNDEPELFASQVLSNATREEFLARGQDPIDAFAMLKAHQDDIVKLFDLMPMGENTPGVVWHKIGQLHGDNVVRLGVKGSATSELRFAYFDMILESGNWRLRWFGP